MIINLIVWAIINNVNDVIVYFVVVIVNVIIDMVLDVVVIITFIAFVLPTCTTQVCLLRGNR